MNVGGYARGSGSSRGRGDTRTVKRGAASSSHRGPPSANDRRPPSANHVLWKHNLNDSSSSSKAESSGSELSYEERNRPSHSRNLEGVETVFVNDDTSSGNSGISSDQISREDGIALLQNKRVSNALSEHEAVEKERTEILESAEFNSFRELPYDQLVELLPKDTEGKATSIGSVDHEFDTCNPCAFMIRSRGCKQGVYCGFCHLPHSEDVDKRRNRPRPCKAQRMRFQKALDRLKSKVEENPEKFNADKVHFPPSIQENEEKKGKVMAILKDHQFQTMALNVVDKYNEDKEMRNKMSL